MPMHCDGRSRLSPVLAGRVREMAGREEASADAFGVALKKADALHATRFGPEGGRIASIDLEAFAAADPEAFSFVSLPPWRWLPVTANRNLRRVQLAVQRLDEPAAARVRSAQDFVRLRCDAGSHSGTFFQESP